VVKVDSYKTAWVGERKRTQQHGIHDAENGRVGPHAQSQRQDGHNGECGLLDQHAQTIANILKQSPHEGAPVAQNHRKRTSRLTNRIPRKCDATSSAKSPSAACRLGLSFPPTCWPPRL